MLGKFEGNSSWDGFPAYQFSSSPAAPLPPSEQFHSNVECPPSSPPLHSEKIARESVFNAFLFFRETASLLLAASSRLRGKRLIPLPSSLSTSVRHPSCFLRGWRRRGRKGKKKMEKGGTHVRHGDPRFEISIERGGLAKMDGIRCMRW